MKYPDYIPYDQWINSQLSVARHYGGIQLNGIKYIVDYIFAEDTRDGLCKPDLVEEKFYEKKKKDNPEKVRQYYEKSKQKDTEILPF